MVNVKIFLNLVGKEILKASLFFGSIIYCLLEDWTYFYILWKKVS